MLEQNTMKKRSAVMVQKEMSDDDEIDVSDVQIQSSERGLVTKSETQAKEETKKIEMVEIKDEQPPLTKKEELVPEKVAPIIFQFNPKDTAEDIMQLNKFIEEQEKKLKSQKSQISSQSQGISVEDDLEHFNLEYWQNYYKDHPEEPDIPADTKDSFIMGLFKKMVENKSLHTVRLKDAFNGAQFGRYAEMIAFYNDYFVITRHYDKKLKALILTIINMNQALDPNVIMEVSEDSESLEQYKQQDESFFSRFVISRGSCTDASLISYFQRGQFIYFYRDGSDMDKRKTGEHYLKASQSSKLDWECFDSTEVKEKFDQIISLHEELRPIYEQMKEFWEKEKWQDLIQCLFQFVNHDVFKGTDKELIDFCQIVIQKLIGFELFDIWNSALIQIQCAIMQSKNKKEIPENINELLQTSRFQQWSLKSPNNQKFLLELAYIEHSFGHQKDTSLMQELNQLKARLLKQEAEGYYDEYAKPIIRREFLRVYCIYFFKVKEFDNYYRSGLQLVNMKEYSNESNTKFAKEMSLSILGGQNIYNVQEFTMEHETVFNSLAGTEWLWLHTTVSYFGLGMVKEFFDALKANKMKLKDFFDIDKTQSSLEQRVRIIALIDAIQLSQEELMSEKVTYTFQKVMDICKIEFSSVKSIISKVVQLQLIKATIDQGKQVINIDSCIPKILKRYLIPDKIAKVDPGQTFELLRYNLTKPNDINILSEFNFQTTTKDISSIVFSNQFYDIMQVKQKKLKLLEEIDIYSTNKYNEKIIDETKERLFLRQLICAVVYKDKNKKKASQTNVWLTTIPTQKDRKMTAHLQLDMINKKATNYVDYQQNQMKVVILPELKQNIGKAHIGDQKILVTYGIERNNYAVFTHGSSGNFTELDDQEVKKFMNQHLLDIIQGYEINDIYTLASKLGQKYKNDFQMENISFIDILNKYYNTQREIKMTTKSMIQPKSNETTDIEIEFTPQEKQYFKYLAPQQESQTESIFQQQSLRNYTDASQGQHPGHSDTLFLVCDQVSRGIISLLPFLQGKDLSQPFGFTFASHPSFGVVELVQDKEGDFHMLIGNKSEHLMFTFEEGQFMTIHQDQKLYIQDRGSLKPEKNESEFIIKEDGSIICRNTVLKIGEAEHIAKRLLDWNISHSLKDYHQNVKFNIFVSQAILNMTQTQYSVVFITGDSDQNLNIMSAKLSPQIEQYQDYDEEEEQSDGSDQEGGKLRHQFKRTSNFQTRTIVENYHHKQDDNYSGVGHRLLWDDNEEYITPKFSDEVLTWIKIDEEKKQLNLRKDDQVLKTIDLSLYMSAQETIDQLIIINPEKNTKSNINYRDYQVILNNSRSQQSYFRLLHFSKIWPLNNINDIKFVFKGISTYHFLHHKHVSVGQQKFVDSKKQNQPGALCFECSVGAYDPLYLTIESMEKYQFFIQNDIVKAGYVFQDQDQISYLKIDTFLQLEFMTQKINLPIKLEILNKVLENILNMARFDFATIFEKQPFITQDIFQLNEVFQGQCSADLLLLAAKRLDELDVLVEQEVTTQRTLMDLNLKGLEGISKRNNFDVAIDFNMVSCLDRSLKFEEGDNVTEALVEHLANQKRSKNHQAVLMLNLQQAFDNDIFPKNFSMLFFDKEALLEIGEEETIFLNTRIGWHIDEYSNFEREIPLIQSYPQVQNFLHRDIYSQIDQDYSEDQTIIKNQLTEQYMRKKKTQPDDTILQRILSAFISKKQKASYCFVDYNWLKIGRMIDKYRTKTGSNKFTYLELALIMKLITENYQSDTKNFKTIRNIIDYQYYTYSFKIQCIELIFVLYQMMAFQDRLFTTQYVQTYSAFQIGGQMIAPLVLITFEMAQLKSLGWKEMYQKFSFKFLTDFLLPPAFAAFFIIFRKTKLRDYDGYEIETNVSIDLQEMINDGEYETIDKMMHAKEIPEVKSKVFEGIDQENYAAFVIYSYILVTLIFVKFKNNLMMSKNLNNVITLIEESLIDAAFFLIYYVLLLLFFCIHFMILGSVVIALDYPNLNIGYDDSMIKYPYYLIQNFRNSVGDFQVPSYQFWQDYESPWSGFIIYIIWVTWIANILFSSLLMLNFLITVFSETHERVLANSIDYAYKTRAGLNVETISILKTFNLLGDIDHQIITTLKNEDIEEEVEALGIITNLTSVIKEYSGKIAKSSRESIKDIKRQLSEVFSNQVERLEAHMDKFDQRVEMQIGEVKQHVQSQITKVEEQVKEVSKEVGVKIAKVETQVKEVRGQMEIVVKMLKEMNRKDGAEE